VAAVKRLTSEQNWRLCHLVGTICSGYWQGQVICQAVTIISKRYKAYYNRILHRGKANR
jgi:hypothetical protein